MASPEDDSRTVIVRLSLPAKVCASNPTRADATPAAGPVWNVPCEAMIERTWVRDVPSQIGVKDAWPEVAPCDTVTDDA